MLAGFIGVGMLYMEQLSLETGSAVHSEYGILILIGGCISWALGTLYAKYRSSGAEEVNAFAGSHGRCSLPAHCSGYVLWP